MKLMRLAMVAAFALTGGIAVAEDYVDLGALQAKLAAQEARLNDLQAKIAGDACAEKEKVIADGLTSLRKNAVVTIGGQVNTRFYSRHNNVDSALYANSAGPGPNPLVGRMRTVAEANVQTLRVTDGKLEFKIDVNDYFDAYLKLDVQDTGTENRAGIAQNYWIRWKNVCKSGFGLLIGRDSVAFGTGMGHGGGGVDNWVLNYGANSGDSGNYRSTNVLRFTGADGAMFAGGRIVPAHNVIADSSRIVQIKPYWESQNGKFKLEASIFEALDTNVYGTYNHGTVSDPYFRAINFGFGSFSARATIIPIEGLKLSIGYANLGQKNNASENLWWGGLTGQTPNSDDVWKTTSRSQSIQAGIQYIPTSFKRLKVWAQYQHDWNSYWIDDYSADVANFGVAFNITDQFTWFGYGDLISAKNGQGNVFNKGQGWAFTTGLQYVLPYGVNLEAGYRHESVNFKGRRTAAADYSGTHTKYRSDMFYGHVGFNF